MRASLLSVDGLHALVTGAMQLDAFVPAHFIPVSFRSLLHVIRHYTADVLRLVLTRCRHCNNRFSLTFPVQVCILV
jgi:hypothetical protein